MRLRHVLQALAAIVGAQDRPEGSPRTGAIHIDPQAVNAAVAFLLKQLPPAVDGKVAWYPGDLRRVEPAQITVRTTDNQVNTVVVVRPASGPLGHGVYSVPRYPGKRQPAANPCIYLKYPIRETRWLSEVEREWRRVLTHELTHARDPAMYSPGRPLKTEDEATNQAKKDRASYINEPEEVRARIAEVVRQLQGPGAYKDLFVDFDFPAFSEKPEDWASRWSPTWGRVKDHLTPENRRLFLRAIGNVWEHARDQKLAQHLRKGEKVRMAPERLMGATSPHVLKTMTPEEVVAVLRDANSRGKQEGFNMDAFYGVVMEKGPHVLVDLPVHDLDVDADHWQEQWPEGPPEHQVSRIAKYKALKTEAPPIYATFGERAAKRGGTKAYVMDGNHRTQAAREKGLKTIPVMMPQEDWERFSKVHGWSSEGLRPPSPPPG